jgi:hypothetical protein
MATNTHERIAAAVQKINPSYRARTGYKAVDVFVSISCFSGGWWVNVDGKRVADDLPTIEEALDALEAHADRVASSDDDLARTLGIAS